MAPEQQAPVVGQVLGWQVPMALQVPEQTDCRTKVHAPVVAEQQAPGAGQVLGVQVPWMIQVPPPAQPSARSVV